jgi:uncharacterized membrane protein (DUF485 family)
VTLFNVTGSGYRVVRSGWDSHTKADIKDIPVNKNTKKITFTNDISSDEYEYKTSNITIDSYDEADDISIIKDKDRYRFDYVYKTKSNKREYVVSCDDIVFLPKSSYKAHFICPVTHNWVDFECDDCLSYKVFNQSKDSYKVVITTKNTDKISFHSVGVMNFNQLNTTFDVIEAPTPSIDMFELDFTSMSGVFFIMLIALIWIVFVVLSAFNESPIFSWGELIIGMIVGFGLLSVSWILTASICLISIGVWVSMHIDRN